MSDYSVLDIRYHELLRISGESDKQKVWHSAAKFELHLWTCSKDKVGINIEDFFFLWIGNKVGCHIFVYWFIVDNIFNQNAKENCKFEKEPTTK